MTDEDRTAHERLADDRERDAERLEGESDRIDRTVEEAKATVKQAADDPFVASPAEQEPDDGGAESDYPAKR